MRRVLHSHGVFFIREGTWASLSVLALGAGTAELAAVFLLDGLQAGFADVAVFVGHVGFGDFSRSDRRSWFVPPVLLLAVRGPLLCRRDRGRLFFFVIHRKQDQQDTTPTLMALSATLNAGQW